VTLIKVVIVFTKRIMLIGREVLKGGSDQRELSQFSYCGEVEFRVLELEVEVQNGALVGY
jgi:hypothetical protein